MINHSERPTDEALERLDHIVDTEGISYADAREKLGLPEPDNSMFTADRIKARNQAHATHVDLYHVPDDPSPLHVPESEIAAREISKARAHQAAQSVGSTILRS